jgi:hypothetical protein
MQVTGLGMIGVSSRSRGGSPGPGPLLAQMKVIAMTTTQPGHSFTRWMTAPFRAFRHLNEELTSAGAIMARSNRFPQPRPQADVAEAKRAHPASAAKVLMEV